MDTKIAIVILNWNGRSYLQQFLPSVIENSTIAGTEIIVVDNCSTDDSLELLEEKFPSVRAIKLKKNYGFAKGYALSLPQIQAEYYVLLNSDVEVTENWLEGPARMMDNDKTIAAVMPKIKSYIRKDFFEYAGAAGGFIDKFGYPFCRGRMLTSIEQDNGQYDDEREIFWASGACMFLRASAYSRTGGLDGDFFAHMEEIDLCWRLKRLGYKIFFCPQSTVYHVGGGTLPNDNPRKLYYNYRNSLFLLFKNINKIQIITLMIPRMLLDGISSGLYLLQGKIPFFFSVLRAHIRFYLSLGMLINKRRIFNKIIAKKKVSQIYNRSIVFDFFLRRKKNFNDLNF